MSGRRRDPTKTARERLSPWTRAGIDLMRYGPAPKRDVIAAAVLHVPPGTAVREFSRTATPDRHDIEHQLRVGARWVVQRNFGAMRRAGTLVEFEHNGEPYWELSPRTHRLLIEVDPIGYAVPHLMDSEEPREEA